MAHGLAFGSVLHQQVHQSDGRFLHLAGDAVDTAQQVVVEHLQHHGHDQTEHGGEQCHLDTAGHDGRTDVVGGGDLVEGQDHPHNGSQEPEHGGQCDEEADPGETALQATHFHTTVGHDGLLGDVQAFVGTVKALIEDAGHGTAGVAADLLGGVHATGLHGILHAGEQLVGVGGGHVQVDHTLDHEGETQDQAEQYGGHPYGVTLDESVLEGLFALLGTIGYHLGGGCCGGILGHDRCGDQADAHQAGQAKGQELAYHGSGRYRGEGCYRYWFLFVLHSQGLAEREGFEPPIPFGGIRTFQARAFNHSAISPRLTPPETLANLPVLLRGI